MTNYVIEHGTDDWIEVGQLARVGLRIEHEAEREARSRPPVLAVLHHPKS